MRAPCTFPREPADMASLLTGCPLFHGFSARELRGLLPAIFPETRRVKKGASITRVGDRAERLSFIVSGRMSQRRSDAGQSTHCFSHHGPGSLLGLEAMLSGQGKSHVELVADEDSELLLFSAGALMRSCEYSSRLKDAALLFLANDSVRKTLRMDVLAASGLREKAMTFFRAMRDKYDSDTFQIKMTQGRLAEYLGVNRSALSRELNNMQREGILKILPNRSYHIMLWNTAPLAARQERNTEVKTQ